MILDVASEVLELVRERAGTDAEAEVTVLRQSLSLTRFANSFIHQNLSETTTTVRLRLHAAGRTVTVTGQDDPQQLVERTTVTVAHAPLDPRWPGLTPPVALAGQPDFDERTAEATPAERAAQVRAFVDAAGGLTTAGYCRTRHWTVGYANTAGHAAAGRISEAAMDGVVSQASGAAGTARAASVRLSDLDSTLLGARAAAKARAGSDPVQLPPGRYEVVLEPPAVADILQHISFWALNGKALAEGRSFIRPGTTQFDPSVTLVDDPLAASTPGRSFDAEGTPTRRLVLVDAGVSAAVAHDRRTAAKLGGGATSTGHAVPDGARSGAFPAHLSLLPGEQGTTAHFEAAGVVDPTAAELVGRVERGLLVTDLWYTRPLDPKTVVMSGVTRNGVWLIEDGKITTPVRNLRFTQSYPQALAPGAVKGIGRAASVIPAELITVIPSWVHAPALHTASWNFTGGDAG